MTLVTEAGDEVIIVSVCEPLEHKVPEEVKGVDAYVDQQVVEGEEGKSHV